MVSIEVSNAATYDTYLVGPLIGVSTTVAVLDAVAVLDGVSDVDSSVSNCLMSMPL